MVDTASRPTLIPPHLDQRLQYRPLWGHPLGVCRARIWQGERPVALVTELDDNPASSVTNSAEEVGSAVELLLHQQLEEFDLVEHYEGNLFRSFTLALVMFAGRNSFGRPVGVSWAPLPARLGWLEDAVVVG